MYLYTVRRCITRACNNRKGKTYLEKNIVFLFVIRPFLRSSPSLLQWNRVSVINVVVHGLKIRGK